jgi:hypothetical protein
MALLDEADNKPLELVEIPNVPRRQCTAESAAEMYRNEMNPAIRLIQSSAQSAPPLRVDDGASPIYNMGPERGGAVRAYLRIVSEPPGAFERTIPLRMLPYKTPEDPTQCFDARVCQAVDCENSALEEHNRYITSLVSLFVHQNGCGTSAGHVTLPSPPENLLVTRVKRLDDIFKDRHSATMLAVRYLYKHGRVCEQDYRIEDAVNVANDLAMDAYIADKRQSRRFRIKIPGSPPTYWSGDAADRDELGRRITWVKGKHHSFISPEVLPQVANDELIAI